MAIVRVASALRDRLASVPLESVHSGMGANLVGDECSFRVWAPNAIAVSVHIWCDERVSQVSLAPEPSNSSYWSVDVADVVAGQPYQFSIVNKGGDPTNPGGILTRVDAYELGFNAVWGTSDPFAFLDAVNGENTIDNLKSFIGWTGFDRPWNFIRYLLGSHDRIADSQSGKQTENRYFVELCGGRDN
jgi:hypothetical protein